MSLREIGRQDAKTPRSEPDSRLDRIGAAIVDAALEVHRALGPGLLESIYEECLAYELGQRGLACRRQVQLGIVYKELSLDGAFRADLLVNDSVLIEIKAVDRTAPVHAAQLLSYMRLTGHRLGYLINFNVPLLRDGIRRFLA